jgi:ABC-type glycerol-3-phosphate transport system substrate-binding protein
MIKKIICCLLLLFGIIGLVSCDNDSTEDDGDGDLVFNENGEVVYDNVILKMFSVTTGDDAITQDSIVEQFNELYKGLIKVEVEHISRYDLENSLQSIMEFDREAAPDIIFNHGARTREYAENEWIKPIDIAYEKGNLYLDKDDFVESLLESTSVDGRVYGIPQDVHSTMIEIRTDILEKREQILAWIEEE